MKLDTFYRYWNTVRYLKRGQIAYYIMRRCFKYPRRVLPVRAPEIRAEFSLESPVASRNSYQPDGTFMFLRETRESSGSIDWECSQQSALWRYNLHYFDYLRQEGLCSVVGWTLIRDWISRHAAFEGIGWHPYPVSLRLVNWIYFITSRIEEVDQQVVDSVALQASWLSKNVEYHILANHLFENVKALLFAGGFLGGSIGKACRSRGLELLSAELDEQFLRDGGHFERSPMYHRILTHDLLDLCNLFSCNRGIFPSEALGLVSERAKMALDYLAALDPPDHSVPFFNDSANGIALSKEELEDYALRIIGFSAPGRHESMTITSLTNSGYYVVREPGTLLLVDCGEIGPDYQPGHAHCDTLSFEYFHDGRKLITNCGTFGYALSDERRFARSTAAHNTVVIDEAEQSEVWGAFRVARRARPINPELSRLSDTRAKFVGAHDGYERLASGLIHRREIDYSRGGRLSVVDSIEGRGEHKAECFLHFVSGLDIRKMKGSFDILDDAGRQVLKLTAIDADTIDIISTDRYPEFGLKESGVSLCLRRRAEVPFRIQFEIEPPQGAIN